MDGTFLSARRSLKDTSPGFPNSWSRVTSGTLVPIRASTVGIAGEVLHVSCDVRKSIDSKF